MTSYSNFDMRIKKIKETIDDIRGDLESLKYKSDLKNQGTMIETQNFNPNTTQEENINKSENTIDGQSENSLPNTKYSVNGLKNAYDNDFNLYRTRIRNKNIYESDTDLEGGRTVNLANSRSDRNLINLPYEHKPNEKNMSYNTYDNFKNNELEYKTYNHKFPRSHSMNRLETNYNYGSTRNQYQEDKSKSFSTKKFEVNNNDAISYRKDYTEYPLNKKYSNYKDNRIRENISVEIKENSYRGEENIKGGKNYSRNYSKELNKNAERINYKNERSNLETFSSNRENSIEIRKNSYNIEREDYLSKTSSGPYYRNNIPKPESKTLDSEKNKQNNGYKFMRIDNSNRRRNIDSTYETKNEIPTKNKEDKINDLNSIIAELTRKNAELHRQLSFKDNKNLYNNTNIQLDTKRQDILTLERNERSKDHLSLSPRFYHNNNENSTDLLVKRIKEKLNVYKTEEIFPILDDMILRNNIDKLKENLFEKLQVVYQKQNPNSEGNDVKELWRWLKNIIKSSIKNGEILNKTYYENDEYKEFCDKIIFELGLKDIKELKSYMNELAAKNVKNRTRVERMKKLLLSDPTNKHSINDTYMNK